MRVLFLTEWFDPIPAHKGLAFVSGMRDAGYDVEVATSFPFEGGMSLYRGEVMNGIRVHRLPHYRSHDASGLRRSLTFLTFFLSALAFGLWRGRRYDVVYAYHPPITVGLAAALFCGLWRKPVVLDVLDLWPDVVTESGMARPSAVKVINVICSFVYRRSTLISVPAKGFKRRLVERGVPAGKIALIYNFADEAKARAVGRLDLNRYRLPGRFNIVYGGNFGLVQQLDTIIAAARLAHRRDPAIQLLLIGSGSDEERIKRIAAEAPGVVAVHPPVPMSQIGDLFAAADLLVANLTDSPLFRAYLPQKLQFYMAMGKPILGGIAGEGAEVIHEAGAGFAVPPGDPEAMAEAMLRAGAMDPAALDAMGRSGRSFYMETMSSDLALRKLLRLFDAAVASDRPDVAEALKGVEARAG